MAEQFVKQQVSDGVATLTIDRASTTPAVRVSIRMPPLARQ